MLYLVTGGSGSGKSEYAETLVCNLCRKKGGGEKYYIATMIPYGEETKKKIARHRELRKEKAFHTKECYLDLKTFAQKEWIQEDPAKGTAVHERTEQRYVLLECMSNLVANELFEKDGMAQKKQKKTGGFQENRDASVISQFVDEITEGIRILGNVCEDVVVVTNEVCSESTVDSPDMLFYKQVLAGINRKLAASAVQVVEVVYGQPFTGAKHRAETLTGRFFECSEREKEDEGTKYMRLIIGGAFQGKLSYAKEQYPNICWVDGSTCEPDALVHCQGMYHFETYIKRRMQMHTEETIVGEILTSNPEIVLVSREVGYGLVPVDVFERKYREQVGRICTELAVYAESVERVVCGIVVKIK